MIFPATSTATGVAAVNRVPLRATVGATQTLPLVRGGGGNASPMQALMPIGLAVLGVLVLGPIGGIVGGLIGVMLIAKQNKA